MRFFSVWGSYCLLTDVAGIEGEDTKDDWWEQWCHTELTSAAAHHASPHSVGRVMSGGVAHLSQQSPYFSFLKGLER